MYVFVFFLHPSHTPHRSAYCPGHEKFNFKLFPVYEKLLNSKSNRTCHIRTTGMKLIMYPGRDITKDSLEKQRVGRVEGSWRGRKLIRWFCFCCFEIFQISFYEWKICFSGFYWLGRSIAHPIHCKAREVTFNLKFDIFKSFPVIVSSFVIAYCRIHFFPEKSPFSLLQLLLLAG